MGSKLYFLGKMEPIPQQSHLYSKPPHLCMLEINIGQNSYCISIFSKKFIIK